MDENVQLKEGEGSQFPMFLGEVHFVTAAASIHLPVMMRISLDYPNSVVCMQRGKVDVEQDGEGVTRPLIFQTAR